MEPENASDNPVGSVKDGSLWLNASVLSYRKRSGHYAKKASVSVKSVNSCSRMGFRRNMETLCNPHRSTISLRTMEDPLRIGDLPEGVQKHLQGVAIESRLWSYERNQIAATVDFIDERVSETSGRDVHSLWDQLVLLVYNTLNMLDQETQRESWLALGEVRQAIRSALAINTHGRIIEDGAIFRAQFSELIDHVLEELMPTDKLLS